MPYLTRAGPNLENVFGLESRGYHVFRRGCRVRVVWGRIHWPPESRRISVVWSRATVYHEYRRSSPEAAANLLRRIVQEKMAAGYSQLPVGCRITPARYASGVTRRR